MDAYPPGARPVIGAEVSGSIAKRGHISLQSPCIGCKYAVSAPPIINVMFTGLHRYFMDRTSVVWFCPTLININPLAMHLPIVVGPERITQLKCRHKIAPRLRA